MNNNFPILHTHRLLLNEVAKDDAIALFEMFSAADVVQYYDLNQFSKLSQAQELIERDQQKYLAKTHLRWAVRIKKNGNFIGSVGIKWNQENHSVTLGYEFNNKHWGKGYATEAIRQVIHYLFKIENSQKINRIQAYVMQGNSASKKVLLKLGFKHEGLLTEYGYWKEQYHDLHLFSIIKTKPCN